MSLNPYCSGQWPRTVLLDKSRIDCLMSLNPCCSGQWSRTMTLRMVKYGLKVLILVVVDNGLVQVFDDNTIEIVECLNPCCSGQWSRTIANYDLQGNNDEVLILVVVDNGLVLLLLVLLERMRM